MIETAGKNERTSSSITIDGPRLYEVVEELCDLADQKMRRSDYFSRCFETLCSHLNANVALLNIRLGPQTLERSFVKDESCDQAWFEVADPLVLRAQTDQTALTKTFRNKSGAIAAQAIAAPVLSAGGKPFGATAFVLGPGGFDNSDAALVKLSQLLSLIVENAPIEVFPPPAQDDANGKALQSVIRASDYQSIEHLCFAIANSLCSKLRCEQISIGLVHKRDVKLIAVSGLSEVPKNTPGVMAMQQAMAVCFDRNETTMVQESGRLVDQCESSPCLVHHVWHQITNGSSVATLPLRIDGQCVAVVSLRRQANQPFVPDDVKRAQILAESFAPALPLVDRASRSIVRHVADSAVNAFAKWYSWHGLGRKFLALLFVATAVWFTFGTMDYDVLAPCRIVPEQINTVSAPYQGMIAKVFVLPGDRVKAGQLLIQIDTRELLIEKNRILSEIASTCIEANAFLRDRKQQDAFLLQAQIRVLNTDLQLIEQQLQRANIRALEDGVVLPTEIHRRVGQFVNLGEPLLEVADENCWHLEIDTPENQARHLSLQQQGLFQSNARPDQRLTCRIAKISPSSQIVRQKNVVIVEAALDARDEWMKIGMEGHVRVNTGKKPVWWTFLHPVVDYVRLRLWL